MSDEVTRNIETPTLWGLMGLRAGVLFSQFALAGSSDPAVWQRDLAIPLEQTRKFVRSRKRLSRPLEGVYVDAADSDLPVQVRAS